ncbi:MAG TPA: galactokinase [Lacunisphaera sp.]|jgi:galactokinase
MTQESKLALQFQQLYGHAPTAIARAPGRVEFIGNHTDYNGGAVLGAGIDRHVWVAVSRGLPDKFRFSSDQKLTAETLPSGASRKQTGTLAWLNYPLGVWNSLGNAGLARPADFDFLVHSDLPPGAGLSSSAALELATALAFLKLADAPALSSQRLAEIGRDAENNFVGVPCGVLDQGTSAFAQRDHLVYIDCSGPKFSAIPMPHGLRLWVFNSLTKHALIDGMYAQRHAECQEAAKALGVALLATLSPDEFRARRSSLSPVLAKRAEHIVEEHARVGKVVAALANGNIAEVGKLLTASHRSSQHLFENSTPELDFLVDQMTAQSGVFGARLTGGGFGGAVLALTGADFSEKQARQVANAYATKFGRAPEILPLQIADGARLLSS